MSRLPKVATAKRRAREGKVTISVPQLDKKATHVDVYSGNPPRLIKTVKVDRLKTPDKDPLADAALGEIQRTCKHPHMRFERFGAAIRCIDCRRRWFAATSDFIDMPNYLYSHPELNEMETRHSPFVTPRMKP